MTFVSRHPRKRSRFRRAVRDENGEIKRWLVFEPQQVQNLSGEDFNAIRKDIGASIVVVKPSGNEKVPYVVDFEETERISGRDIRDQFKRHPRRAEPNTRRHWIGRTHFPRSVL